MLKIKKIGELLNDVTIKREWIIDGVISMPGTSLLAGQPKAGKSTFARQIAKAVCTGQDFLGRTTSQGSVLHCSFDEEPDFVHECYTALGVDPNSDIFLHIEHMTSEIFFTDLRDTILELKPKLTILDTLFDVLSVQNEKDYNEIKQAMRKFKDLAKKTNTHIMFIHHMNKSNEGGPQSIMGSNAIFAAVDCALLFTGDKSQRYIQSIQRGGKRFPTKLLKYDEATQTYSLGPEIKY